MTLFARARAASTSPLPAASRAARAARGGVLPLLAALLVATPLAAQRLPVQRFGAEQGLAGSQIWDIVQDRRGLVWVATTWGFSRFDGERFATFSVAEGLLSPSGRTVVEDRDGNLWFGNNAGVARFDGRSVEVFAGRRGAPRTTVWDGVADADGRLWFGSEEGLHRWAPGGFRRFGTTDGLADDYVYALLAASDGALWIGSRGSGLARCLPDAEGLGPCRIFTTADGLGSNVVRALVEDREGRVLIGTRGGGVAAWDGRRFLRLGAADGLPSDDVYALAVRADGTIAVGTAEHGMAICLAVASGSCRRLDETNGLPENGVRALAEDREGNLWIGTEGGLGLLVREDLWNYTVDEGLPNRNVYAIAAGAADELWLGTFRGVARLRVGFHGAPSVEVLGVSGGLPGEWVWAIARDGRGSIWIGTDGGLCRIDRGDRCAAVFRVRDGLPSSFVLALAEGTDGAIWVGTTDGLARLDRNPDGRTYTVTTYGRDDGLADPRSYAIQADGAGRVWFAHGDGLSVFERGGFHPVGAGEGLALRAVRGLGLDGGGRLLVGGWGRVARLESGPDEPLRFHIWDRRAGLGDEMVLTLAEGRAGRLLLGTNRGIAVLDPEAAAGAGAIVGRVDASTGAVATEVSHTAAHARDARGNHWFGFKGGLTGLLGPLAPEPSPPAVAFARLESERGRIFLAPFSPLEKGPVGWLGGPAPELPHTDSSLRVSVRSTAYSRRDDLRYQFLLEGEDADWSEPRPEPFRDLMRLAPGRHRLLARAARAEGPWSEPVALEFGIEPAWWQTAAFPWIAGLGLVGLVATGIGLRQARVRQLERELERRIAERTDDLARYADALSEHLQTVDRASDRARQAERARRDLFARASHELRTPLTAVLGFSELLERALGERLDAKERRYLANVRESSELLLRQINELLEHLKLESGRIEIHLDEVALESMIDSVASLMEGFALHRGVRLELDKPAALPVVRVDAAKLRQALMNLVSNAVKFSPAGGTVTIAAVPLEADATPWGAAGYRVTVRDRGPGIPADELETIFEPYRRLESALATTPGTGLGLPIARQFVELLGGRLEVETAPGEGASFHVVLPLDPGPLVPQIDGADSRPLETERAQILVFDPDRERFARLVGGFGEDRLLAVRVENVEALRRALGSLRPRALVLPFDPAAEGGWWQVAPVLRPVRERRLQLVLVPTVGGRALALPFAGVVAPDAEEGEVRRALRAGGVVPRHSGRRPLVLIAGTREAGIEIGVGLSAAGCDHFRVEGHAAVRAALVEATPDAVATDVAHALGLAAEAARRNEDEVARGVAWILFEAGVPEDPELARLAERVIAEGDDAESALAPALARLLGRDAALRGAG